MGNEITNFCNCVENDKNKDGVKNQEKVYSKSKLNRRWC